jgi:hypothetical protein
MIVPDDRPSGVPVALGSDERGRVFTDEQYDLIRKLAQAEIRAWAREVAQKLTFSGKANL